MSRKSDIHKNEQIQVFARCRPINNVEEKQGSTSAVEIVPEENKLVLKDREAHKEYHFDRVFSPHTEQIVVYKAVVEPLIHEVILGYNCTVLAYGQTGTGKTYTMEGKRNDASCTWENDPGAGLIPRSLHQLFEELNRTDNLKFSVKISFLEIYNEDVYDLLGTDFTKLRLYEDPSLKDSLKVSGLNEVPVISRDEVYTILEKGTAKRHTAETFLNAASSRSHTIFTISVLMTEHTENGEKLERYGKLNLVDLAGSENVGRSGAVDKRAREAGNINQSLLTLGRVITSLIEKHSHVPYRESKLTRLLQFSLGGQAKTSIIATISPAQCNYDETVSTLDYAAKAKTIDIKPEINRRILRRSLIMSLNEENERLRKENEALLKDVEAARGSEGFYVDYENYMSLVNRIADLEKELEDKREKELQEVVRSDEVDKVHKKVKRKQTVANTNEDACSALRILSEQQCVFLHDVVTDSNKEVLQFSESIQVDQNQMNDILTEHRISISSLHETLTNELQSFMDGISSQLKKQAAVESQWANDLSQDMDSMKDGFLSKCDEFLTQRLPSLLAKISAENTSMDIWVTHIYRSTAEKVNQHTLASKIQIAGQKKQLGMLNNLLESFFLSHNEAIVQSEMTIQNLKVKCQDAIAYGVKCCAVLQERIQEILQFKNISRFEKNATQLRTVQEPLYMSQNVFKSIENEVAQFGCIPDIIKLNKFLQKSHPQIPAISEVSGIIEVLRELPIHNHEKTKTHLESRAALVQENNEKNKQAANEMVTSISNKVELKESCLVDQVDFLTNISSHSKKTVIKSEKGCLGFVSRVSEELLKGDSEMQKILTEGLATDVPTGTTPQRMCRSPRSFVETSPFHKIVQDFQSEMLINSSDEPCFYKGNESANTSSFVSSPDTSFASADCDWDLVSSMVEDVFLNAIGDDWGFEGSTVASGFPFDDENKENCEEIEQPSKLSRRKSVRFADQLESEPLGDSAHTNDEAST